ncbi:MAG: PEP-utilizing enzyme [Acidimicrobiia bacterium]|nr:PEP-utilizing enzyme [Acidimicrobiia bacterium]
MAAELGDLVVRLDGSGIANAAAGGKGSALDRLVALGANVPTTSVITTASYREFAADPGLALLLEELRTGELPSPEDHEREKRRVDEAFLQVELPSRIVAAIAEYGPEVGNGHLIAVRSSATAEDTASASFAGQYSSYLNVDEDGVSRAVRLVWSSLWHPAPRSYRRFRSISEDDLAMAAVLMSMLDPSHAGVIFTTDPGGAPDHLRLEVVEGLAESLVSGEATPEAYVVARAGAVEHLGGIDPMLGELVAEAMRIEAEEDAPQDIEWAVENGVLFLVQARPITTDAATTGTDDGFDVHTGLDATDTTAGIGETLPGVLPPLDWDINSWALENGFRRLFNRLGGCPVGLAEPHALIGRFRGRAALNLDAMMVAAGSIPGASPEELQQQYFGEAVRTDDDRPAPTPGKAGAAQGVRTLRARLAAAQESEVVICTVSRFLDDEPDLGPRSDEALVEYRGRLLHLASRCVTAEVSIAAMATASYRSIEVFLTKYMGQGEASRGAQLVTAGSGGSRRATIALAMGPLVDAANADPELRADTDFDTWPEAEAHLGTTGRGRVFLATYQRALERAGSTSYFGGPTWAEVPELAWLTFRQQATTHEDKDDDAARQAARDEIEAQLVSDRHWTYNRWATGQIFDVRRRFFRREAADAAELLDRREHTKAAMLMLGGAMRRLNLQLGRRLVEAGRMEEIEDVTLLGNAELAEMVRGGGPTLDTIATRRRRLSAATLDGPLPRIFEGLPGTVQKPEIVGEHVEGWGASPGRYEGPVRVVRSVTKSQLVRGDVLVANATDASWAPLFLLAGAIVVEEGGPLSHAAIVARELGMPAVVNVPGIVDRLDCDPGSLMLAVDGTTGEIVISTDDAPAQPTLGAGVAPLRSPAEPEQQLGRMNVFVTGLIGAGALFSTLMALTESKSSRRGRARLYRKAYPIAETMSEATRSGYLETRARLTGIRPRSHYLIGTIVLVSAAIVLGGISTRAYIADDAGASSNVAFWALSMSGAATLGMVGIYFGNAVARWPHVLPTVRRLAPSRPTRDRVWIDAIGKPKLGVIAVLLGTVGVLGILAALADSVLLEVDRPIYENIDAGRDVDRYGPEVLNWLGRPIVIIPLAVAIALAMIRCRVIALAFPLAVVAAGVSNVLLGYLVRRDRPPLSDHFGEVTSFPGGHFMQMTLLFGVLPMAAYIMSGGRVIVRSITAVLSVALVALILTDTFRTGGHWPSDQLAGFLIGSSLVIAIWGLRTPGEHHDSCSGCPSQAPRPPDTN